MELNVYVNLDQSVEYTSDQEGCGFNPFVWDLCLIELIEFNYVTIEDVGAVSIFFVNEADYTKTIALVYFQV